MGRAVEKVQLGLMTCSVKAAFASLSVVVKTAPPPYLHAELVILLSV